MLRDIGVLYMPTCTTVLIDDICFVSSGLRFY